MFTPPPPSTSSGRGFQAHDVRLLHLQFRRVLDGDRALLRYRSSATYARVEQRGLARSPCRQRSEMLVAAVRGDLRSASATCRRGCCRSVWRDIERMVFLAKRRTDTEMPPSAKGGMTRSTRCCPLQAGVDQGPGLVDVRRPTRVMIFVATSSSGGRRRGTRPSAPVSSLPLRLDVDLLGAVDQDIGDGLVAHQRLERAEAEHVRDQRPTSSRCSTKLSWILVSASCALTHPVNCASKAGRGISAAARRRPCVRGRAAGSAPWPPR